MIPFFLTAIFIVMLAGLVFLYPRKAVDSSAKFATLMAQIRRGHHTRIVDELLQYTLADDWDWWLAVRGIPGLLACLDEARTRCLIAQVCYAHNLITAQDAWEVWSKALCQVYYTARALPEAVICRILPILPHQSAHTALLFHNDLILRTETVCLNEDAPDILRQLPDIR